MKYETVIGLEVHAQLKTQSKLFCGCSTEFGHSPNHNTCEVCLGMPGVLPVLNEAAVALAVRAGLALDCTINLSSQWSRKNYFYPDLPKGYQITQFERPYAEHGSLLVGDKNVQITRIHMEEDAGKSVHDEGDRTYVDFNRGGTPLIEIVSEPDLRSSEEAAEYLRSMRRLLRFLDVCDGNMEEGSMRCDANVSLRPVGQKELGTRAELKNINSFRFLQQAIDYEVYRQAELLDAGKAVVQETRLWDGDKKESRSMRSKEDAHDYRYFPEPDLPDLLLTEATISAAKDALPELPAVRRSRYVNEFGLPPDDAGILVDDPALVEFFEGAVAKHDKNPKAIANWTINEVLRDMSPSELAAGPVSPAALAELVALIDDSVISGKIAKDVFAEMLKSGAGPAAIVKAKGLEQVSDTGSIEPIIDRIIAANADNVAQYRAGKTKIMGFFVGQVMKETQGKANPKMVNELLRKKLSE